jgi:hypothetical protein
MAAGMVTTAVTLANAEVISDRFTAISQRNVFGLKAPPQAVPQPVAPPPPAVTVKLTGIISFLSSKKAIFLVTEQGKPAESKVIAENQTEGAVEVKEIDPLAGIVKVIVSGREQELNFDKDGVKPPTAAAAAAGGPAATGPPANPANPVNPAMASVGSLKDSSLANYLSRASAAASTKSSPAPLGGSPAFGGGMASPIAGQTFSFDPNYNTRPAQPSMPVEKPVSQEESIIYIELAREQAKTSKIPMPPLPPTILTPGQENPPMPPSLPPGLPFPNR